MTGKSLRLALVTPRFWPLADDLATQTLRLAEQFRGTGHEVTVVSATWHRSWAPAVQVREIPLVRLGHAPRSGWSLLRYSWSLSRWLKQRRDALDAVLVASLRYEAYAAIGALAGSRTRVVLLADAAGPGGDVAWQSAATFGSRIARRAQGAAAIVATSSVVAGELTAAGYPAEKIVAIPWGVPLPPVQSACVRDASRQSLAGANHDLIACGTDPVVLAIGQLTPPRGFAHLIKAWKTVAARFPAARLWIAGDGPERERLYQLIGDLDLRQRAFLPGTFSDQQELLEAADAFVQPATSAGPTLALAEALAIGLPAIATDLPCHRPWIEDRRTGRLVAPGDARALAATLIETLEQPAQAVALGAAARETIRREHSLEQCAARYLDVLRRK
jgi:glycosyltransferase involved in cell wall biosynthesis